MGKIKNFVVALINSLKGQIRKGKNDIHKGC